MIKESEELWKQYLNYESLGIKSKAKAHLDTFITAMAALTPNERTAWVHDLCIRVVDQEINITVRMQLFERLIFPVLDLGIKNEVRGCARWLAFFANMIHQSPMLSQENYIYSKDSLLRQAIIQNPGDRLAREKLVESLVSYFDYSLHEIPAGVLYDFNGANQKQCLELLGLVDETKMHLDYLQKSNDYMEFLDTCTTMYRAYYEYLGNLHKYQSFSKYLETAGIPY